MTFRSHRYDVFYSDSEFAGEVDAGFYAEAFSGFQGGGVALDNEGGFVALHADAVARSVHEELAVAGLFNDLAGGLVDGFWGDAGVDFGSGGVVGVKDDLVDLLSFV
jgi:hypothetical protein